MSRPPVLHRRTRLFSSQLAARILAVAGAASIAVAHASCTGGGAAATGGSKAQGTGGATTSTATTSAATGGATGAGGGVVIFQDASLADAALPPAAQECIDPVVEAGTCPGMDAWDAVIFLLDEMACNDGGGSGVEAANIMSGPTSNDAGQCCYVVEWMFCPGGGRPYFVDGEPRVAPAVRGAQGWSQGELPRLPVVDSLTAAERADLAAAWTADALLEHASVASFARSSLTLLAAGAPSELVAQAHQAALDEVRHARLCFALATAYAGEPVAPGPFPVGDRVDVSPSLAALAASTVREGCIGETLAAILAAEQLARATDPAVQAALSVIADDEARHAELAWRTVAWAVQTGGSAVRAAVAAAFDSALAAPAPPAEPGARDHGAAYGAHGRLDAAVASQVVAAALGSVVAPGARALLQRCDLRSPDLVEPWESASS